jgi:hypothetical protein
MSCLSNEIPFAELSQTAKVLNYDFDMALISYIEKLHLNGKDKLADKFFPLVKYTKKIFLNIFR